jgi:hypothetical protein
MQADMDGIGYSKQDAFCCKWVEDVLGICAHACCILGYSGGEGDGDHMSGNKILVHDFSSDFSGSAWVICDHILDDIYPHNNSGARIYNYPPKTNFQTQK